MRRYCGYVLYSNSRDSTTRTVEVAMARMFAERQKKPDMRKGANWLFHWKLKKKRNEVKTLGKSEAKEKVLLSKLM